MSYHQGGYRQGEHRQSGEYRQGADLYRPSNSLSNYPRNRYQNEGSSYRSNAYASRTPSRPQKPNAYHQVYSQTHQAQAENQLWMGDLDPNWTENDIAEMWTQAGETPTGVKIMRDKMGKALYSFVSFATQQAVATAIQKNRMQVPGTSRTFKLNWASGSTQGEDRYTRPASGKPPVTEYSIFVGDLGPDITEPVLFARFNKEYPGSVRQVKIMMDLATKASKGFGFVRFNNVEAQQGALRDMNGVVVGNRAIRVGLANGSNETPVTARKGEVQPVYTPPLAQQQPALTPFTDPNNSVITVTGITSSISRNDLVSYFITFGHIIYCRPNYSTGVAHIKYYLRTAAERALLFMHGFVICGCRVALGWGREELTEDGVVRFVPVRKTTKYAAVHVAPPLYGTLSSNIVFEDVKMESLTFTEQSEFLSVEQVDKAYLQKREDRNSYLEQAF